MTKTGVWLDIKKAIIVRIKDENPEIQIINSGIDSKERESGEKKKFGRFANQFLSFEKSKQRKMAEQEKKYFKSIIDVINDSDEIVLFGPSSTKIKLEKEIKANKSLKFDFKGTQDADSMTDNQVKAWVTDYYK